MRHALITTHLLKQARLAALARRVRGLAARTT